MPNLALATVLYLTEYSPARLGLLDLDGPYLKSLEGTKRSKALRMATRLAIASWKNRQHLSSRFSAQLVLDLDIRHSIGVRSGALEGPLGEGVEKANGRGICRSKGDHCRLAGSQARLLEL